MGRWAASRGIVLAADGVLLPGYNLYIWGGLAVTPDHRQATA